MTRYLLDSNILTVLEDRRKPGFGAVTGRLGELADEDEVYLSILSAYEYQYGIARAPADLREALSKAWTDFESRFAILDLSLEGAEIFARLKSRHKESSGTTDKAIQRHTVDLILASSALEHEAVLVSDDAIFEKLRSLEPSLQVENWRSEN